ncbi:MAG: thymidine phosphorylase [Spirochaetales bacterium]|nr:thymidine phosphorylase [Spirochaetales bacterium]
MRMPEIIRKKQLNKELSPEEIRFFVNGYTHDEIPDYQAAALTMAIWFNGMSTEEIGELTLAMAESGDTVDLSSIKGIKVDKHSSGGVADTTTIAVGPLVAACGGRMAKMSGRGLAHSGGTLDKLESIPGFSVNQDMQRFSEIVNTCGVSIIGQTANLVPADKKLYALRDVTATVDSMPLIAASIMSKKLAAGGDKILLDVKWGSGAFMHELEKAEKLARIMVDIGKHAGKETRAMVTDMNQPLGNAVGNALEVMEAIEILRGDAEGDLKDLIMELSAQILIMGAVHENRDEALKALEQAVSSGAAVERLKQMISLHGGNPAVCDDFSLLPQARKTESITAESAGYITAMQTDDIGTASVMIGAGREKKSDSIDPAVGLWLRKRLGDRVETGDVLADFYVNDTADLKEAADLFKKAVRIDSTRPEEKPLIVRTLS